MQSLFSSGWLQAQLNDTHRIYIAKAIFGSERDENFTVLVLLKGGVRMGLGHARPLSAGYRGLSALGHH